MILYAVIFYTEYHYQKHVNSPCEVGNKDTWTFKRVSPQMNVGQGIKDLAAYEVEPGCCGKLKSILTRDKLDLIMELMKHSLGTPIPDEKLNYSFNEFSLLRPSDDLI